MTICACAVPLCEQNLCMISSTEAKPLAEKLGVHIKALGDPSAQPQLQNIGTQLLTRATADLQVFKKLAQVYTLTGENRKTICIKNAQVSLYRDPTLYRLLISENNRPQ